ncbi:Scr1 family TA system antitoxin-like transcriptional regulator [Streptomyces xinghaiensis]|uniref:Scr1 family TA system antitoxin-like transcriptional regulator n=1 Tax=Streptomyces xinghaiensis TaxID=1038928 RepID=UPI0037B83CC9
MEMESICDSIRTYQVQLVPGLLQTAEQGRAVTVASRAWQTPGTRSSTDCADTRRATQVRAAGMNVMISTRLNRVADQLGYTVTLSPGETAA